MRQFRSQKFYLAFSTLFFLMLVQCQKKNSKISTTETLPSVLLKSEVDKALMTTDETLNFMITLNSAKDVNASIPEVGSRIEGFRIIDFGQDTSTELDNRKVQKRWYKLQADISGSYILPKIEVQIGEGKTEKTSEIFVEVNAPNQTQPNLENDIRDIKGIESLPFPKIIFLILGILLGGGILFYFIKKYRKRVLPVTIQWPHELAMSKLNALELNSSMDLNSTKQFHFSLSEIIRNYVEAIYEFGASDMTSEEISKKLKELSLDESYRVHLNEFLKKTDFVKFTNHGSSKEDSMVLKEKAIHFVEITRPKDETKAKEESVV